MKNDVLARAQQLRTEGHAFALATVVAARQPTSGIPGARAIVMPDGRLEGWVGGHCAQPAIMRQGLAALADGHPRLVVISPTAQATDDTGDTGVVHVPMLCGSQGEIQVFVEPFLSRPSVIVVGSSVVAQTLARLASTLDFEVWACDPHADMESFPEADRLIPTLDALQPQLSPHAYVIVATIGEYDEEAALSAIQSPASYVGLVASNKRLTEVRAYLTGNGVRPERAASLKRPKGLPGFVIKPEEIAFSVMAELLETRRLRIGLDLGHAQPTPERAEAIDPICGMTVDIATARFTAVRDGETFYFCCPGCKKTFEKQGAAALERQS